MNTELIYAIGAGSLAFLIVAGAAIQQMNRRLARVMTTDPEKLRGSRDG